MTGPRLLLLLVAGCGRSGAGDKPADTTGIPAGTPAGSTWVGAGTPTGTGPCLPPLAADRGGDAGADAASGDPWFVEVEVAGLSDDAPSSGVAWVDLDRDGDPDAVLSRDRAVEVHRNDGCFRFAEAAVDLDGLSGALVGGAMAADLSGDGWLDLYFPSAGPSERGWLLVSDGAWDAYTDQAVLRGVDNAGSYSRGGAAVGDIDGDGWYDLSLGGHQIGGLGLGRPFTRLYRFAPGPAGWSDGAFVDLAGTADAPGFGGAGPTCVPGGESTGPETRLFDADGDGDLDLLWLTHNDMYATRADDPCATGTNPYGPRLWLNDGAGRFTEQAEGPGAVSDPGRMNWNAAFGHYVVGADGPALGAETVALFDADNDGDRDLLLLAPTDPDWHVSSGQTTAGAPGELVRYLRNDGGGVYTEATAAAGFDVLDRTLGAWAAFFDFALPATSPVMDNVCALGPQQPLCDGLALPDRQPYPANPVAFDADNDGWVDVLFVVRQCQYDAAPDDDDIRSVLLHNRGDGTFVPLVTEVSGVVGCGLAGFAVDVDGDGWLDLHLLARDELQGIANLSDRILRNMGAERFPDRHHTDVIVEGRPEPELLGARIVAIDPSGTTLATGWVERDRWRGSADPVVHLGLGTATAATLEIALRDGTTWTAPAAIDGRTVVTAP